MENNKSLRIRTDVGNDQYITVNLEQEYDILEILSMKIDQKGAYRYNVGDYGVIVGRVLANNGFGVPNAKLSLFIERNETNDVVKNALYPYDTTLSKDSEGRRYNLLPDLKKDDCHQVVGSFPNKRLMLDDASVLEVFDEYYKYTTRTNEAGDYMFFGIPTGSYTLHMDLDISDCGKLSQRPRDFIYKGYTMEQFENPNQFKVDTEFATLPQIFSQDTTIDVKPFWGDSKEGTQIGITRKDIDVTFKFEPTCVFMGSIITDNSNEGISKKCVPSDRMGEMGSMVTGPGTIEIIRKNIDNTISELQIKGTQLIDGNGVWCFQIPMNLDYVMTDEYGNTVPTDNPEKGIPTRCEVRFRLSLDEANPDAVSYNRGKILVPHNPRTQSELDYNFGSRTKDSSFKSLMWNNVYTIKSFIPRFQKARNIKTDKFTGIKKVNMHRNNNPMPYNNIRIKIPFMFWFLCNITKLFVRIIQIINILKKSLMSVLGDLVSFVRPYSYISNEICSDLEYWYFAPGMKTTPRSASRDKHCRQWENESVCLTYKEIASELNSESSGVTVEMEPIYQWKSTIPIPSDALTTYDYAFIAEDVPDMMTESELKVLTDANGGSGTTYYIFYDKDNGSEWLETKITLSDDTVENYLDKIDSDNIKTKDNISIGVQNMLDSKTTAVIGINLTDNTDYLMQCVEINLAQEYEVIKFDFYNDWINGTVYLPRWAREVKYKRKRKKGTKIITERVKGCFTDTSKFKNSRRYVQQCSVAYDSNNKITTQEGCHSSKLRCHENNGRDMIGVFGTQGGVVNETKTSLGDNVYYLKPYEFRGGTRIPFFATDIVMLGTLFDCNEYGLPSTFENLVSTTYQLPPALAQTNLDDDTESYNSLNVTTSQRHPWGTSGERWPAPSLDVISQWACNKKCPGNRWDKKSFRSGDGAMVTPYIQTGVTPNVPTYDQLDEYLSVFENEGDKGYGAYVRIERGTNVEKVEWVDVIDDTNEYNFIYEELNKLNRGENLPESGYFNAPTNANSGNTLVLKDNSPLPPKKNNDYQYIFYRNGFYKWEGANAEDNEASETLTLAYEDIFPVTEVSGIDWSYGGVGYDDLLNVIDKKHDKKMLAPGGHFLGLSCGNAETNIRSCVNLKRACEIGTSLSERIEIPIGFKEISGDTEMSYDIINYLYVAPNGLIAKDQILDTSFRSAFATMNQNSLRTVKNTYGYKTYDFRYLLPDSFDGSLSNFVSNYTQQLSQGTDKLWNSDTYGDLMENNPNLQYDVEFESGNTIIRNTETKSDDYVTFRMGDNPKYLYNNSRMPVYENSFYFYFGLVNGSTALDEFKTQYYAPCAPQVITQPRGDMVLTTVLPSADDVESWKYFKLGINVKIVGLDPESIKTYTLTRLVVGDYAFVEEDNGKEETKNKELKIVFEGQNSGNEFTITGIPTGVYDVLIQDEFGNSLNQTYTLDASECFSMEKFDVYDYIISIDNDSKYPNGVDSEPDTEIGGYLYTFKSIKDTINNSNIDFQIVIKKVEGENGVLVNPINSNSKWYKNYYLYLWGYGDYELWIRSYLTDENRVKKAYSEFKYSDFTVGNGVSVSFTLKNREYFTPITYDELINDSTDKDKMYSRYRVLNAYNEGKHKIILNNIPSVDFSYILCGQGESTNDTSEKLFITAYGVPITNTAASNGFDLNLNDIDYTMNDGRDYPFYYISFIEKGDDKMWSTKSYKGMVANKTFTQTSGDTSIANGYYLLNQEDTYTFVEYSNGSVSEWKKVVGNGTISDGSGYLVDLAEISVYRKEFKYEFLWKIPLEGSPSGYVKSSLSYGDLVTGNTNNKVRIADYDFKYVTDEYNNVEYDFTTNGGYYTITEDGNISGSTVYEEGGEMEKICATFIDSDVFNDSEKLWAFIENYNSKPDDTTTPETPVEPENPENGEGTEGTEDNTDGSEAIAVIADETNTQRGAFEIWKSKKYGFGTCYCVVELDKKPDTPAVPETPVEPENPENGGDNSETGGSDNEGDAVVDSGEDNNTETGENTENEENIVE